MTETRLAGADFVRAAACMIVLAHHLAQRLSWSDSAGFMDWFRIFSQVGTLGVAMFFVLSGFLLAQPFWQALDRGQAMPSLATYALRRAARIVPGFWLALWVTFALTVTVFAVPITGQLLMRAIAGTLLVADWHWVTFFPVEINGPLWSIGMEVSSYLFLPLGFAALFAAGRRGWTARALWLGVISVALLAHLGFVAWYPIDNIDRGWDHGLIGGAKGWMPYFNPFGFFAMFAIGALAAGVQVRLANLRHVGFDALALVALAAAAWWLFVVQAKQPTPDGYGWLHVPYSFPGFALCVAAFLALSPQSQFIGAGLDNRVVRYLARISFGIYVWHYVALELVRLYLAPDIDHGKMADPIRFIAFGSLITGISIAVADLSYRFLESPVIRWARRFEPPVSSGSRSTG